jgi:cell division protein FtsB
MELTNFLSIIQTASIVLAMIVAVTKLQDRSEGKSGTIIEIQTDIKYIKQMVTKLDSLPMEVTQLQGEINTVKIRLEEHIKRHDKERGELHD